MIAIFTSILAMAGMMVILLPGGTSAATSPEDSSNITTSNLSPEPFTMKASSINLDNQTSNQTNEKPKTNTTSQARLSKGVIIPDNSINFPYKVTVRFDSITVNDNHEVTRFGNAEIDISAFVQGIRVDLTGASARGEVHTGDMPHTGLGDASEGETIYFDPGTEVTVYLPSTLPLSIFTVGQEVDGCGRIDFNKPGMENLRLKLVEVFKDNRLNWQDAIDKYLYLVTPNFDYSYYCAYDENERLGNLIKFYGPPGQSYEPIGYGAGAHTNVVSDTGDFTLRYTITVTPPPIFGKNKQLDSNPFLNQMQQQNSTITFNKAK